MSDPKLRAIAKRLEKKHKPARPKQPAPRKESPGELMLAHQLATANIPFEREYQFHPSRKWRADFALLDHMLLIEVHGAIFVAGRHSRGAGQEADFEKGANATLLGWYTIAVSTGQVKSGLALLWVKEFIDCQRAR